MNKVDLHIHTNFSDGLFSPSQIVDLALSRNLEVISITDHDTLEGSRRAIEYAAEREIRLIPAVEISSYYQGKDVHILAYDVDVKDERLNLLLKSIEKGRYLRAIKMLKKLQYYGFNLDLDMITAMTGESGIIGRPHIAQAMVQQGYVASKQEAFNNFIGDNAPAYVAKPAPNPKKTVRAIKKAGGVPVLAHPYTLNNDNIVYDLICLGIMGLEVYYAKNGYEMTSHYERIACDYDLIRTGGSDFHGDNYDLELFGNIDIPDFVVEELDGRINTQQLRDVVDI